MVTAPDQRKDYGEERFIMAGHLRQRLVALVGTQRGNIRRFISLRYGHAKEAKAWAAHLD